MGRIKTKFIKRTSRSLIAAYDEEFKEEFGSNKEAVSKLVNLHSKKMRNTIAGYVTRMKKQGERQG
ncbi:30S ribosomal protein S17e [Candidatus Woesearchaeota archaeon]|nr:30S ribosomal protein S17e [Candidatus Woesearchaeota archaeon]